MAVDAGVSVAIMSPEDCISKLQAVLATVQASPELMGPSKTKRRVARFIAKVGGAELLAALTGRALPIEAMAHGAGADADADGAVYDEQQAGPVDPAAAVAAAAGHEAKGPYIVFIGQLSYEATHDAIDAFLRGKGIEGDVKIRLMTDKKTKKSKGSAFVELEGSREMNKCIALHHSKFQGRRINIERSCGGRNKGVLSIHPFPFFSLIIQCHRLALNWHEQ
jgi:hypothetical protein